ncbi:septum site-determining protein MinC [Methylibium sp.]|uniref:septum site-determining protein MinC n=1 Tax=Methylibium sp. TaxID=2067992 RepID=UPI001828D2D0|nr:septum site-determining protein MinC [Methylibium sp.]MBA3589277.1 septum site-determining protein MinC [Methylibium sp.]
MAVVQKANAPTALEIKSAALTLIAVVLKTTDLAALARELDARVAHTPGLFEHEPVIIDLGAVREEPEPIDFAALIELLHRYDMLPIAARRGGTEQMLAALAAGLAAAPDGSPAAAPASARAATPEPQPEVMLTEVIREVPVPVPAVTTLVIDKPLRSGQQVYARGGDLVVMAAVSFGAEVIADGHIHVYAPLRGRAIAGARGNTEARIFSTCMEPQLVAIAGTYRTLEADPAADVFGKPAQVRLDGDKLLVEALGA